MYRSLILCVTALVSFVAAQGGVPSCATPCIVLPTQCNGNPECICKDQSWISDISCCIFKACDTADQQQALNYAQTICTPVNATLPAAASCSNSTSNSTSASSSGSATSAASSSSSTAKSGAAAGAQGAGLGVVAAMLGVVAVL